MAICSSHWLRSLERESSTPEEAQGGEVLPCEDRARCGAGIAPRFAATRLRSAVSHTDSFTCRLPAAYYVPRNRKGADRSLQESQTRKRERGLLL